MISLQTCDDTNGPTFQIPFWAQTIRTALSSKGHAKIRFNCMCMSCGIMKSLTFFLVVHNSFKYTTQWFDIYMYYKMLTIKCSYHLSPQQIITLLLTVFPLLYLSSFCVIYFITGSLYLLIPFTYFTCPSTLTLLAMTSLFSVIYESVSGLFICSFVLFF